VGDERQRKVKTTDKSGSGWDVRGGVVHLQMYFVVGTVAVFALFAVDCG